MSEVQVLRAEPSDAAAVADLIALAFHPLRAAKWLAPDPAERLRMLAGQFAILVEHASVHGTVCRTSDGDGVAVWFDRTRQVPEPPDYQSRLAAVCGGAVARFTLLDELFETRHPAGPHHHLAFLAVTPAAQGRGLGTALLEHHHAHLDAHGVPAYLEASSERNRALYARHGYQHDEPFRLPDETPFWPMWREPRAGP